MAKSAQNLLEFPQKSADLWRPKQGAAENYPWERLPGEPARYYMLFRAYALMGHGRSLQAIAEQERRPKKAPKSPESQNDTQDIKVSISGALKKAATQWRWRERAAEWDLRLREERQQDLLAHLDHEASYVTRAQRLDALDTLMANLMRVALGEHVATMDYRNWLAMHRQMLATLREIRREMAAIDKLGAGSLAEVADRLAL